MDCVYLDVDIRGEMNAKTTHEIIAMLVEEFTDLEKVETEVESIQQWRANLPDKTVYGTTSGDILYPLKVETRSTQRT